MEDTQENQQTTSRIEDPTKGISHSPLSESERKDPLIALRNLPGYITTAVGRMYQDRIREGGGAPDTSNRVILAAAGKSKESIGEAAMGGGIVRANKQIELWKNNGISIPESMQADVKNVLVLGFVGLNIAEAGVLITAGEEPYKQLLSLEEKGGVVDWVSGSDGDGDNSGTEVGYTGPTDSPGGSYADADNFWSKDNWND